MNCLEEKTDGEAMIQSITHGEQPLPVKCGYKKDNYELNYKFLNNLEPEWKQYGILMRQTKNLMDININALYNILKQNQGDINEAMGYKKKAVEVTSDPLVLVAKKTKVNKGREKVVVHSYNLRTSSASTSPNKKPKYVKLEEKKEDVSKVKYSNCKKERHFAKDCKKAEEISANMVFMDKMEKILFDLKESSSSAKETIAESLGAYRVHGLQSQRCSWRFLDTLSSVRGPKHSDVIWKKKGLSNTSSADLSSVSNSKLNKDVNIDANHALLTNYVEKFLRMVLFGNNNFAVIVGYGDVVIGSMMIKKVYYVEEGSNSSSLNNDVKQSSEEVEVPSSNTQSVLNNMFPNVGEASTSHNMFNEQLEDAYFNASTMFHNPSNVHTFYQPYPHEKKWAKDHPLQKIIGDPKSSVRTRGQIANSCLISCLLCIIKPVKLAEALKYADWVSAMQKELDDFARLKVWRLVPRPKEEVGVPLSNTQSISNNMVPNVDEASTSHNVFNEHLEDAYFDANTSFYDPSNEGERVGRGGMARRPREGNDECVDDLNGQGNDQEPLTRHVGLGCLYKVFLACNSKEYDGKGGVVVLTRWIEKIENVKDMSGCSIDQKVKYTTGSFVGEVKEE
uniref:Reverse transcriptase domain-containing protein n=1 Tax=Tanacetum cinerariifolium TaxID=118510 RepID=A0A6L2LB33_TANCI|nr:reverse transcriptase domain-containing protein [Tanacetum cinerariifolium]